MGVDMLYIGCCGFCMARQKYYTVFNAIELQDTFYNPLEPEKLKSLVSEAPQGFVFAMKVWQAISHPSTNLLYSGTTFTWVSTIASTIIAKSIASIREAMSTHTPSTNAIAKLYKP